MAREERLIRFEDGEVLPFEAFFKEYFSKFHAFASRFVEDQQVCEDMVQETFIAVWESREVRYASLTMLQAYMYRTLRNKALNHAKHHRIREAYTRTYLQELASERYLADAVLEEELHHVLYSAIRRLTPQCREVIRLHLEGKSNKEIAETKQINVATVKSHKAIAYRELRVLLKDTAALVLLFF